MKKGKKGNDENDQDRKESSIFAKACLAQYVFPFKTCSFNAIN